MNTLSCGIGIEDPGDLKPHQFYLNTGEEFRDGFYHTNLRTFILQINNENTH